MKLLLLSEAEVTALLDLDGLVDALEDGFRALTAGRTDVPARIAATAENGGWLGVMPGYGAGLGLGVKLVSVFPHNERSGLPSHQAIIALFGGMERFRRWAEICHMSITERWGEWQ